MRHADWLKFFHSRNAVAVMGLIAVAATWLATKTPIPSPPHGAFGLVRPVVQPFFPDPDISFYVSAGADIIIALLLIYLNKTFNPMRAMTKLQAGFFLVFEAAVPASMAAFGSGEILAIVTLICVFLMYASYANPDGMRNVFLAFLLISAFAAADTAALILLPVFWLALGQMRILSPRAVLASLMGISTPWVILLGLGIVPLDQLQFPKPHLSSFYADTPDNVPMLAAVATTAFLAVAAWVQNAVKILSYTARFRAFQSVLTVLTLVAILAVALNYTRVIVYLPLLNCCAALQAAHLFAAVHRREKSYIAILSIIFIYILFYSWTIIAYIS